jgi:hypothetical protein
VEGAVQEWIAGISTIQATYPNDVPEQIAGNVLIGGAEANEEAGRTEEAASIAGVMRNAESVRSAEEKMENAAAARTAATS